MDLKCIVCKACSLSLRSLSIIYSQYVKKDLNGCSVTCRKGKNSSGFSGWGMTETSEECVSHKRGCKTCCFVVFNYVMFLSFL